MKVSKRLHLPRKQSALNQGYISNISISEVVCIDFLSIVILGVTYNLKSSQR